MNRVNLSLGTIPSPTMTLITNDFVKSDRASEIRPPGGEYAMHRMSGYSFLSFRARIVAVPAPSECPITVS